MTNADRHAAAEGQSPTFAAVCRTIGESSFTTISEAMKSWRPQKISVAQPMRKAVLAAVVDKASGLSVGI
ncbi:DNA-binding protein [Ferrovum sp. JA12]|uniref:DNA-binding protein n=1 Tax=Ferrovum sp. JA12 TaxID=1356299 RepID=UPI0009E9B091